MFGMMQNQADATDESVLSKCRDDFPLLERRVNGRPIVYLDSAATSLKPRPVIEAVVRFYTEYSANVHRAVHVLSEEATEAFEGARLAVARLINADSREVAFVRNATEALNIVASSLRGRGPVAMPMSEHHSNLLPWRAGDVVLLPVKPTGEMDLDAAKRELRRARPALLTMSSISNALGVSLPVAELTAMARSVGAMVLLDLSQSIGHEPTDVRALDCDFACFSGHKMLAPSGIGVLYAREDGGGRLQPLLVGGSMVQEVHADTYAPRPFPWCLEAGTPNIEGAIGLGAACEYLDRVGLDRIHQHGRELSAATRAGLSRLKHVQLFGDPDAEPESIVSFAVKGMPAHGVARVLSNRFGVIVRSGFHCAQPLHEALGLSETIRTSVHLYNSRGDVEALVDAVSVVTRHV